MNKLTVLALVALVASATALPSRKKVLDGRVFMPLREDAPAPKPFSRIVGGQEATPHQFPWAGHMTICGDFLCYYCTLSIIEEDWIVTAGHCNDGKVSATVLLGIHDHADVNEPGRQEFEVTNPADIITHENYNSFTINNDIGLIRLPTPADISAAEVELIPRATVEPAVGDIVTMAGWGLTHDGDSTIPDVLYYTTDPVADDQEADDYYGGSIDYSTKICIHYDTSGTCSGDSGGPLMYDFGSGMELVGITSFGASAGCESGAPDCFTAVPSFNAWIDGHVNK